MDNQIEAHWQWLIGYVGRHQNLNSQDPEPLRLKLAHTREVFGHAAAIADSECAKPETGRAVLLAALYHDVARFPQYVQYGTFRDADSRDHGAWAVQILKRAKRLTGETPYVRSLVLQAVCLHNRYALPANQKEDAALVCGIVRDADKLDITRVMAEHLSHKPYNPTVVLSLPDNDASNPKVREAVLAGRTASYADLWSVNDFRLLVGAWFFDLHSITARRRYLASGYVQQLLTDLPGVYRESVAFLAENYSRIGDWSKNGMAQT